MINIGRHFECEHLVRTLKVLKHLQLVNQDLREAGGRDDKEIINEIRKSFDVVIQMIETLIELYPEYIRTKQES